LGTWTDKSGSGNNATTFNNLFPTFFSKSVYTNLPFVQFNGTNWANQTVTGVTVMALPNFQNTASVSCFYVCLGNATYFPTQQMRPLFIYKGFFVDGQVYLETNPANVGIALRNPGFNQNISSTALGNTVYLNSAVFNSAAGTFSGGQNGSNSTISTGSSSWNTAPLSISLGAYFDTSNQAFQNLAFNGELYEVIVFNSAVTSTQRQQIEGYLAWKWGLQANLPVGHPYKNAAPSVPNALGISRPPNVLPIPPITISARSKAVIQVLISSGLLARYRLNESSGSTAIDSIAANNITIGGSPSRVSTTYGTYSGYALSIQNATQYGYITLPANMVVGAHSITSWVYFTGFASASGTQSDWVGWGGPGARGENHVAYNTGSITSLFGGPAGISTTNFLDDNTFTVAAQLNTWYFCVTTWDGSNTWKTYCYSPTTAYAFTFSYGMGGVISSSVFGIGISNNLNAQFGGTGYGGYIGEIRFYNRAITAGEVASIYAGTG
jgi:hypothetical protein